MEQAQELVIETPKLEKTAFYVLGSKDGVSQPQYTKVVGTSRTVTMMEMMDLDGTETNDVARVIVEIANAVVIKMAEALVDVFGEGTFLVRDQSGRRTKILPQGMLEMVASGYQISLGASTDGRGLEVRVAAEVFAPDRHEPIDEIHVDQEGQYSVLVREEDELGN